MGKDKIIFLDIDEVVATLRSGIAYRQGLTPTVMDPSVIGMLNDLCEKQNASVVCISTWGILGKEEFQNTLRQAGFTGNFHEDWAIEELRNTRGPAIDRWCSKHAIPLESMIIIDDGDAQYSRQQKTRWIQCEGTNGLSFQDFMRAEALLANQPLLDRDLTSIQWSADRRAEIEKRHSTGKNRTGIAK